MSENNITVYNSSECTKNKQNLETKSFTPCTFFSIPHAFKEYLKMSTNKTEEGGKPYRLAMNYKAGT